MSDWQNASAAERERVAEELKEDIGACRPLRLFSQQNQIQSVQHAYELQRALRIVRERLGEKVIGFKVGCTSPSIRKSLGIAEAVCGYLWQGEQFGHGCEINYSAFRELAIEGELGVRLLSTDGPVMSWIVEYEPVIELHHSGFDGKPAERACELVARNCIHAGVVHGNGCRRCRLADVPLNEPIIVTINGKVAEKPVLRDLDLGGLLGPLGTVSFLKEKLRSKGYGEQLQPGDFILTATPGSLLPVMPGSSVHVAFMQLSAECMVGSVLSRL